jgi:hypothetical protein
MKSNISFEPSNSEDFFISSSSLFEEQHPINYKVYMNSQEGSPVKSSIELGDTEIPELIPSRFVENNITEAFEHL